MKFAFMCIYNKLRRDLTRGRQHIIEINQGNRLFLDQGTSNALHLSSDWGIGVLWEYECSLTKSQ
jgi:hypothetical protein